MENKTITKPLNKTDHVENEKNHQTKKGANHANNLPLKTELEAK